VGTRLLKRHECRFLIERCCCSPGLSEYSETHRTWPGGSAQSYQAWCLACEVDEEVEFSVGCSVEPSHALARALPGALRRVHYGDPAPLYRDRA
jgi:hypothetical protein